MSGWTWHEKFDLGIPSLQQGHCSTREDSGEPGTDFKLDEKTGLFLPEAAAKERRKPVIGFQPGADD